VILTLIEHDRGRLNELSLEALTFGRLLGERLGVTQHALLIGEAAQQIAGDLGGFGTEIVHLAVHDELSEYAPRAWARSLVELVTTLQPGVVVASASDRGAEVMAYAASILAAPLAANCIEVVDAPSDDAWTVTRQRWGGSLLEVARVAAPVKLLTVAPHALLPVRSEAAGATEVAPFTPSLTDGDVAARVTGRVEAGAGKVSLSEAKVVVGGGRGVGGAEGFGRLEELAGLLGGAVGCSRVVTSNGWRPHTDQIGQTGTRIAPDLYIACGISGATQHIVGCRAAKKILVINTDAEAPILTQADYAIIGDLAQIVPAISAEIRKASGG